MQIKLVKTSETCNNAELYCYENVDNHMFDGLHIVVIWLISCGWTGELCIVRI